MLVDDFRWNESGNTIIAGPSHSGKTTILNKIIRNKDVLIKNGAKKSVLLYYLSDQKIYKEWERDGLLTFKKPGVPDIDDFKDTIKFHGENGSIIIFDDLGSEIRHNAKFFTELFLVLSHHLNLHIFVVLHNIFPEGLRELSLNCHKFICTFNPRDTLSISTLNRQCFPGSKNFLLHAYKFIGQQKYGYLLLDFHHETNPALRVSTSWFHELGPIMVFQESGSCSSSPYKCLYVISSDLYKSMVSASKCEENSDPHSSNSSSNAYSSPSIQNNFFPSNNFGPGSDGGNNYPPPPSDNPPSNTNSSPGIPPNNPADLPPKAPLDNAPAPASGGELDSLNAISSNQTPDLSSDTGQETLNDTVSGVGDQTHLPPTPRSLKRIKKTPRNKKRVGKKTRVPERSQVPTASSQNISSFPPSPPFPPPPLSVEEPMNEETSDPIRPLPSVTTQDTNPLSKFEGKIKWPTYNERKPSGPEKKKKVVRTTDKKHQEIKPLTKRKSKFERVLPEEEDPPTVETPQKPNNWVSTDFDDIEMDEADDVKNTHQNEFMKRYMRGGVSKTNYQNKTLDKTERVQPNEEFNEELQNEEASNEAVRNTHQNEFMMRFRGSPHIDQATSRKYPQIKKSSEKGPLRIRKDLFPKTDKRDEDKKHSHLKHKNEIKKQIRGEIRVRKDLFTESTEKMKDRINNDMFKRNNGSKKKNDKHPPKIEPKVEKQKNSKLIEREVRNTVNQFFNKNNATNDKHPPKIEPKVEKQKNSKLIEREVRNTVNQFFNKNNAVARKRTKTENISEASKKEKTDVNEIEHIDVPYMPQHAAPSGVKKKSVSKRVGIRAKNMQRIIENHPIPSEAHSIKKELIEEMEHDETETSSTKKRKNRFGTHPTGPIKFQRTRDSQKGKRKNAFLTHPTGPIKHMKTKDESKDDEKDETSKKSKKSYGSGFKLWKI